jgi:hypothetical protein
MSGPASVFRSPRQAPTGMRLELLGQLRRAAQASMESSQSTRLLIARVVVTGASVELHLAQAGWNRILGTRVGQRRQQRGGPWPVCPRCAAGVPDVEEFRRRCGAASSRSVVADGPPSRQASRPGAESGWAARSDDLGVVVVQDHRGEQVDGLSRVGHDGNTHEHRTTRP